MRIQDIVNQDIERQSNLEQGINRALALNPAACNYKNTLTAPKIIMIGRAGIV